MLAPLVVLEVWMLMSATDQLIIALATFIVALSGLLGPAFTMGSHWLQSKQLRDNSGKLDRIDASTNGTLAGVKAELVDVKAELVGVKIELADLKAASARQHPPGAF